MIEDYFISEGIEHIELFERTLKQELPPEVRTYIRNILEVQLGSQTYTYINRNNHSF